MDIEKAENIIDKMYQDRMSKRVKQTKEGIEIDLSKNVTFTELEEASVILLRNYLTLKRKNKESNQIFEENKVLIRAFNRQSLDIGNYLVELQQKDKQINLMAEVMYKSNTAQLLIEYGIENKEQLIKEFKKLAKEKGE